MQDLAGVAELDEAHWVATTAPIDTINADLLFLDLLDSDDDGRIRASEIKEAIRWLFRHLRDTSGIKPDNTILLLSAINTGAPEGQRIYESTLQLVEDREDDETEQVSLIQVRRMRTQVKQGGLDRAGIVLPTAAPDPEIKQFIIHIRDTVGGEPHPNGQTGVDLAHLEQFLKQSRIYLAWLKKAKLPAGETTSPIMPLGADTPDAYRLFHRLSGKIDHYFSLCSLIRLEPRAAEKAQDLPSLADLDIRDAAAIEAYLTEAPLAAPTPEGMLNFDGDLNPRYAELLQHLRAQVLTPMLGSSPNALREADWSRIKSSFSAHRDWANARPEVKVNALPPERLQIYVDNSSYAETLRDLIEASHRTAFALGNLQLVEKLILYQAYLLPLVNSFVSFPELYDPDGRALFEMGTLIMDGRHFTLAVKVPDRKQHVQFSSLSNMFIMYVEISSKTGGMLYEVAVPVTSGNRGNLQVGKWGIFQDIEGQERHARVMQIVENPISLKEAIVAPFVRLGKAISTKLEEVTSKAEQELENKGSQTVASVHEGDLPAPAPAASEKKSDPAASGGLLAGGGIAIAALGSSVAFITKTLADMTLLKMFGGLLAAVLAVMLPATIVAYIKLSKRDLSAILEGSGWGINARMRLTRFQSYTFTHQPAYPPGSKGVRRRRWRFWMLGLVVVIVILYALGWYYGQWGK